MKRWFQAGLAAAVAGTGGGWGLAAVAPGLAHAAPGARIVIAGTASAEGVRLSSRATGFLIEELADVGGPVSQVQIDPQESSSFASLPYPGANGIAAPGVVAAFGGPSLPAYPLFVSASDSAPEQELADPSGTYRLRSTAGAGAGGAEASVGTADFALRTTATVATSEGQTASLGETRVEGLRLGDGALTIGTLRSFSQTIYRPDGKEPETVTGLLIDGATAGPLSFAYGPDGLAVAQQGVPIPASDGLDALNAALVPAGLSVGFTRTVDIVGGRIAEAFVVEQAGDVVEGTRSTSRYRIGGASSAIVLGDPFDAANTPAAPGFAGVDAAESGTNPAPSSDLVLPAVVDSAAIPSTLSSANGGPLPHSPVQVAGSASLLVPRDLTHLQFLLGSLAAACVALIGSMLVWTRRGALKP